MPVAQLLDRILRQSGCLRTEPQAECLGDRTSNVQIFVAQFLFKQDGNLVVGMRWSKPLRKRGHHCAIFSVDAATSWRLTGSVASQNWPTWRYLPPARHRAP